MPRHSQRGVIESATPFGPEARPDRRANLRERIVRLHDRSQTGSLLPPLSDKKIGLTMTTRWLAF
jgi:hypothetical protein